MILDFKSQIHAKLQVVKKVQGSEMFSCVLFVRATEARKYVLYVHPEANLVEHLILFTRILRWQDNSLLEMHL